MTGALTDKTVLAGDEVEEGLPRVKPRWRVKYGEPRFAMPLTCAGYMTAYISRQRFLRARSTPQSSTHHVQRPDSEGKIRNHLRGV